MASEQRLSAPNYAGRARFGQACEILEYPHDRFMAHRLPQ
jgi:hypothetical protein